MIRKVFSGLSYNFSIKTKLFLLIFILISYSVFVTGYFGYKGYADKYEKEFVRFSRDNSEDIITQLEQNINNIDSFSLQILYSDFIYDMYVQLLLNDKMDEMQAKAHRIACEKQFRSILLARTESEAVVFRFNSKEIDPIFVSKNYNDYPYESIPVDTIYKKLKNNERKPLWYFDNRDPKAPGLYHARMVFDRNTREEVGMFIYKISNSKFFSILKDYAAKKSQNVSIYDSENRELFGAFSFKNADKASYNYFLKNDSKEGIYSYKLKNDRIYYIYKKVPSLNWKVVIAISSNIMLKDVRTILNMVIFLCVITLPIWVILLNFIYVDILKPLTTLVRNMSKIEKGDIGIKVETKRKDEMGFVFNTFNKMSEEISNLINRVYKGQIAAKDAEIKALQAQINPHFLYNTLEAIKWKARIHGSDEISEMVSSLSTIIEANLNRNNENLIPLHREIDYINNYNFLIKKRFGKKIDFIIDVEDDIMECKIPKLLIQPLIENSVYHGLETKKGGGTIELNIKSQDNLLVINVTDNGTGITEETLRELRKKLTETASDENTKDTPARASIGIINVHRRVKLLYGDEYGLEISSVYGNGTSITIKLPKDLEIAV